MRKEPQSLSSLIHIAKLQSVESSNAIEGIVTTASRIKKLLEEKTTPKNHSEQEIAGYRDALNTIHENYDIIPITPNYILQLHKIMCSRINDPLAGIYKQNQNYIAATHSDGKVSVLFTPLSPHKTPLAIEKKCEEYNRAIGSSETEPLIVIATFIHDFLCIHPFSDGNGRMSRLLTTLLLCKNGFDIGKYISLEAKIAKHRELYYECLFQSQKGWHEGKEDVLPFVKYLLGTILEAYKDLDERIALMEEKTSSLEMVRKATMTKIGIFSKQDILSLCPSLSVSTIEGALRKLVADGSLKRIGKGKNIAYYRTK